MEKIRSKFVEFLLAPANAIPPGDGWYETMDGVKCLVEYRCTWNNQDGGYNDELEDVCQKHYGCSFESIKSIWIGRLGKIDDYWHLIKLSKV